MHGTWRAGQRGWTKRARRQGLPLVFVLQDSGGGLGGALERRKTADAARGGAHRLTMSRTREEELVARDHGCSSVQQNDDREGENQ